MEGKFPEFALRTYLTEVGGLKCRTLSLVSCWCDRMLKLLEMGAGCWYLRTCGFALMLVSDVMCIYIKSAIADAPENGTVAARDTKFRGPGSSKYLRARLQC
jgi:hypothetical protein